MTSRQVTETSPPHAHTLPHQPTTLLPAPIEINVRGFDRTLVLYEVYWADLMAGEKAAGSFQMQQLIALRGCVAEH